MAMQCPHCFLDMKLRIQLNQALSECPGCEGLWLNSLNILNIFGLDQKNPRILDDSFRNNNDNVKSLSNGDYYYYKKAFKGNANKEDLFGFELST